MILSFIIIGIGCGGESNDPVEKTCTPECSNGKVCQDGTCVTESNFCDNSTPCNDPTKPHCDLESNTCSAETSDCTGCNEWEYCYYGTCNIRGDRCESHGDCTSGTKRVCDESSHFCVEQTSPCNPACQTWEVCNDTTFTCELGSGNCLSNTDCTVQGKPICDLETHECNESSTDCGNSCGDWGLCYDGYCQVKQDGLHCGEGVPCISIHLPYCNEITHACEVSPGEVCNPVCDFYQSCNNAVCETAYGYCGDGRPCEDPQRPICNSETHLCEGQIQNVFIDPYVIDTYPAVIITTNSLKSSFQKLADLHTLTGMATKVVTVESLGGDVDGIRSYLKENQNEIKYLLIGGDIDQVPSKRVSDSYSQAIFSYNFNETFYTDLYFSELSNWSTGDDPANFDPEIAVGRVPASSTTDVNNYFEKAKRYLTAYPGTKVKKALVFSNVALTYNVAGYDVDFDSAIYMEYKKRTIDILDSGDFSLEKLYHSANSSDDAEEINIAFQKREINKSPNLIVHMGHGSTNDLTSELDGTVSFDEAALNDLQNNGLSIFISGACDAGKFEESDSIGEKLVLKESNGAIAYIGNSTVGLGIAGGSQFIDEFLRDAVTGSGKTIGSVFNTAHKNLPTTDKPDFIPNFLSFLAELIGTDAYRWTQKATVLLGDPMLPVYNSSRSTPALLEFTQAPLTEGYQLTISPVDATKRIVGTILILTNSGNYYKFEGNSQRKLVFKIKENLTSLTYGLYGDTIFSLSEDIQFK